MRLVSSRALLAVWYLAYSDRRRPAGLVLIRDSSPISIYGHRIFDEIMTVRRHQGREGEN
jgi:hypothetical protein